MENKNEDVIIIVYNNVVYVIKKQEWEDLKNGFLNFKDMFD